MYIQTKLDTVFILTILLFLFSCGHNKTDEKTSHCLAGERCTLMGILSIKRNSLAAVGVLEVNGDCISIALPKDVIDDQKRWDKKGVEVSGLMYSHSAALGVISYTLNDREVLVGACGNNRILYLEEISLI